MAAVQTFFLRIVCARVISTRSTVLEFIDIDALSALIQFFIVAISITQLTQSTNHNAHIFLAKVSFLRRKLDFIETR